jgi:hypothetical protein
MKDTTSLPYHGRRHFGKFREVWLVLGGILSKQGLETALSQANPRAEAIQAVTLLHGTLSTIGSIDAKLRIFGTP